MELYVWYQCRIAAHSASPSCLHLHHDAQKEGPQQPEPGHSDCQHWRNKQQCETQCRTDSRPTAKRVDSCDGAPFFFFLPASCQIRRNKGLQLTARGQHRKTSETLKRSRTTCEEPSRERNPEPTQTMAMVMVVVVVLGKRYLREDSLIGF